MEPIAIYILSKHNIEEGPTGAMQKSCMASSTLLALRQQPRGIKKGLDKENATWGVVGIGQSPYLDSQHVGS
jgi:hypothetical protein